MLNVNDTVDGSFSVTASIYSKPPNSFFCNSKVKTTSSAVIGCPSDHLTPSRMVKSIPVPSAATVHAVASQGIVEPSAGLNTSIDS